MARELRIKIRRDSEANWLTLDPALAQGELGLDTTLKRVKIGDGFTSWTNLPWLEENGLNQLRTEYGNELDFIIHLELNKA